MKRCNYYIVLCFVTALFISCSLDEKLYSELGDNYLSDDAAKENVLLSAYGYANQRGNAPFYTSGMVAGETWSQYGAINSYFAPLINFTWTTEHDYWRQVWQPFYSAIRDANIIIANTTGSDNDKDRLLEAEAHFIRGYSYSYLYDWFGGLPIYQSPDDDLYQERKSAAETIAFIEQELLAAAEVLPAKQSTYGRATKGAALGILAWVYLNDKQWQKAAETAKRVIDLGVYSLYPDYSELFKVANEGNSEMIWVNQANPSYGVAYQANILPTDYPHQTNQTIYASEVYLYDNVVNSFEDNDARKSLIVTSYVSSVSHQEKQLLGVNRSIPDKYEFDVNAIGASYGTDIPVQRYADILLIRAEALNELNGPNDESLGLLNQIRNRANLANYRVQDFPTKEAFRNALFQERAWEFFFEQKSRTDQIRQGTFIDNAKKRGLSIAQDYQTLFPIPQSEIDANPNLKQNEGYAAN